MIPELITRLESASTDYETIQHAWTLETIDQIRDPMPMALLLPGQSNTEAAGSIPIRQRSTENVIVITICKWQQLDALKNQLYGALVGYQHANDYTELEHRQGEVHKITGDIIFWMDAFATDTWIQGTT